MVWLTAAVAFFGGGVILVVELSAVRLLAPWFGASSQVWTHVIGVILLALAVGYALGSRLAANARPQRVCGVALCLGAGWVAWLPSLTAPVCEWLMPPGLSLERAASVLGWASLGASCLLFAPGALLLSTLSPLLTESLQRAQGGSAGQAGGRVLAAGTLGSLAGSFLTSYWLIPELGLQQSFRGCALLLAVLGAALLVVRHPGSRTALVLLVPALAGSWWSEWRRPALPAGATLLAQAESSYQSVRVIERDGWRFLQVNEGLDSFQSVWQPMPGPFGGGYYYDAFVLVSQWGATSDQPWRLLSLGMGAGSLLRAFEGQRECRGDGIEIDARVLELARTHMPWKESPGFAVHSGLDARVALRQLPGPYDQIVVDAYANQTEIPAHLASAEFFALVWTRLAAGGFVCLNVGAFGNEDPLVEAIARTLAAACETPVLACRLPFSRNVLLVARKQRALPVPGDTSFLPAAGHSLRRLAQALCLPGATRLFPAGGLPELTDDRSPLESLTRASLARGASH